MDENTKELKSFELSKRQKNTKMVEGFIRHCPYHHQIPYP